MKIRISSWGLDVSATQAKKTELYLKRCLARFGQTVETVDLRLDADPAPPWYRCRVRVLFDDGGKLAVTATATQTMSAVSCALERLSSAKRPVASAARWSLLSWLERVVDIRAT